MMARQFSSGHVEQVHRLVEARVVEDDVQPAEVLDRLLDHAPDERAVAHVDVGAARAPAGGSDLLSGLAGGRLVEVPQGDGGPLCSQGDGDRPAHAASRAGHDDALACHALAHFLLRCGRFVGGCSWAGVHGRMPT
jgi:hypothetical protein